MTDTTAWRPVSGADGGLPPAEYTNTPIWLTVPGLWKQPLLGIWTGFEFQFWHGKRIDQPATAWAPAQPPQDRSDLWADAQQQWRAATDHGAYSWGTREAAENNLRYAPRGGRRIETRWVTPARTESG